MSKTYVVGVSGGKDSTALLLWMVNESGIDRNRIVAIFCDTGNEHQITLDYVQMLSTTVHPIETIRPELDFYELAINRKRFPSAKARFCTESLKIHPTRDYIMGRIRSGENVISVSGVRGDESATRSTLTEHDLHGNLLCEVWRPLLKWSIDDIWATHRKYGFYRNPLYDAGARRVGCLPCVMSRKAEIRMIALKYPERIKRIADAEPQVSTFFGPKITPMRFRSLETVNKKGETVRYPSINDVVEWSMTGKRARGRYDDQGELFPNTSDCMSGFCE